MKKLFATLCLVLLPGFYSFCQLTFAKGLGGQGESFLMTAPGYCSAKKPDKCGKPLRVLTWNVNLMSSIDPVEFFLRVLGGQDMNEPEKRAEEVADLLVGWAYDIVVLQEVADPFLRAVINQKMAAAGYHVTDVLGGNWLSGWAFSLQILNGGVVIYTRVSSEGESVESKEFIFPRPVGTQGWCAVGCMYVKVPLNMGYLHVVGLHLQTVQSNSQEEYEGLTLHHRYLKKIIRELDIPAHEPVLYIGDFNTNAGEQVEKTDGDQYFQNMLKTLNAKEAAEYLKETLPYSFDPDRNQMAKGKTPKGTLDNVLCDKGHICPVGGYLKIFHTNGTKTPLGVHSDHYSLEGILYFSDGQEIPEFDTF